MTEAEWQACPDPRPMLEFLRGKASERKLRLYACACCRRVWHLLIDRARSAIQAIERAADGIDNGEKAAALVDGLGCRDTAEQGAATDAVHHVWECDIELAATSARAAAVFYAADTPGSGVDWSSASRAACEAAERTAQAALLRHFFPFRPVTIDRPIPSAAAQLAEALYAGEPVAFALSDALEEAGLPDLAEHFRAPEHPRGCWAVDLLTGRG